MHHSPGVVTSADGCSLSVAERQVVEQVTDTQQSLNVILKRTMGNT